MITLYSGDLSRFNRCFSITLVILLTVFSNPSFAKASQNNNFLLKSSRHTETDGSTQTFIPFVQKTPQTLPTLNIPFFEGSEVNFHQAAVSWFGQVRGNENYADIRVGYNSTEIYVRVSVFDRFLWYDTSPDVNNLTDWDAVTLYLDINGNKGTELGPTMYSFTRQMQWWEDQKVRQIAHQGNPSGWDEAPLTFTAGYNWRGNAPNDSLEDRGYIITFHIPFNSLGYTGAPPTGTKWGAAITLHDRDDAGGVTHSEKHWEQGFDPTRSSTWGEFSFGLPVYNSPPVSSPQEFTIRNGLDGVHVSDGVIGGNTGCGWPVQDYFGEWGDRVWSSTNDMNVQNQGNIDDWPCYSKFYITFPLDSIPAGLKVISASLTLHQSGQSTGFPNDPPAALNSLIQASVIDQFWSEGTLSWNSAPMPAENVSRSWVGHITEAELGKAYTWDLSSAVDKAYRAREALRLVIYSADSYGPNGKYFFSSDQEWEIMRPSLTVELGVP